MVRWSGWCVSGEPLAPARAAGTLPWQGAGTEHETVLDVAATRGGVAFVVEPEQDSS